MLTIFGRPDSYNVQKVLWFAEELELDFKHVNIGGPAGGLNTAEFLALNPNGLIPVIQDGDFAVWESNTIIRYLAAKYGQDEFWIESPAERSLVERWMDWELTKLQPGFLGLFWHYYRTPENQRNNKRINHLLENCKSNIEILDSYLKNKKFILGTKFSIGDISIGTCFYRYFNMGIQVNRPVNLDEWYKRLCERPCYKNIVMVAFDNLKGRYRN